MKKIIKNILLLEWLPTKFIIRFFLLLIIIIVIQKICGVVYITDGFALGMMGFVSVLIGLKNVDEKMNGKVDFSKP